MTDGDLVTGHNIDIKTQTHLGILALDLASLVSSLSSCLPSDPAFLSDSVLAQMVVLAGVPLGPLVGDLQAGDLALGSQLGSQQAEERLAELLEPAGPVQPVEAVEAVEAVLEQAQAVEAVELELEQQQEQQQEEGQPQVEVEVEEPGLEVAVVELLELLAVLEVVVVVRGLAGLAGPAV